MLSEVRKRLFNNYSIDVKIIPNDTDDDTVFAIYEDINNGGSKLTHHQLRRAGFYGKYIELIDNLTKNKEFRTIIDPDFNETNFDESKFDESKDGEIILTAFAVCNRYQDFKLPWKRFLNKELIAVRDMNDRDRKKYLEDRKTEFEFVMKQAYDVFGRDAFRKYNKEDGEWAKKVDAKVLFSSLYAALANGRKEGKWTGTELMRNKDKLKSALEQVYKNDDFLAYFSGSTVTSGKLLTRRQTLENIISTIVKGGDIEDIDFSCLDDAKGLRSFPRSESMIQTLFVKQSGKCGICKQTMEPGSYVHIDHIQPYSKGGKTVEENGQLVHALCNQSKGAN
jgi:hypothetical protein